MMPELITDRTQADVFRYQELNSKGFANMTQIEKEEWLTSLKGCYNLSDLNRVGEAVEYISEELNSLGYMVNTEPKLSWVMTDIPSLAQMNTYINNIKALRAALEVPINTPNAPDMMSNLTYLGANDIGRILEIVQELIENMARAIYYSGEIYCGEV